MEKKYQVFISSTYTDLVEERRLVMEALLQMNCFPVGMEYFNASDESQWEMIKKLIDDCDYYILIVAGRYGSIDSDTGKSYTQMEFEYAIKKNKTVLRFVHENPGNLIAANTESSDEGRKRLDEFKKIVQKKYCKFWDSPEKLQCQVILSLQHQVSTNPQIGWIKADNISSEKANKEIIRLREENDLLKAKLDEYENSRTFGIEDLSQGDECYNVHFSYETILETNRTNIELSWNTLFAHLAPHLVSECNEIQLCKYLSDIIGNLSKYHHCTIEVDGVDFQNIKIQFIALGLIKESVKKRTSKDNGAYWTLTKNGLKQMFFLKAIKKKQ